MWMPAQTTVPPLRDRGQRLWDELAGGREDDRGVELLRPLADGARPDGAELARQRLRRLVARAREGEHAPSLLACELGDDVRRGAEAVEPDAARRRRRPGERGSRSGRRRGAARARSSAGPSGSGRQ